MRYAGFNRRSWAYTIDATIVTILTYLQSLMFGGEAQAQELEDMVRQLADSQNGQMDPATLEGLLGGLSSGDITTSLSVALVISAIYNIVFVITPWQATPGKHWLGIKVVDVYGESIGIVRSTMRHAASALSYATLFLGFAMAGWTREKTALHDLIAGTRVIYDDGDSYEVT